MLKVKSVLVLGALILSTSSVALAAEAGSFYVKGSYGIGLSNKIKANTTPNKDTIDAAKKTSQEYKVKDNTFGVAVGYFNSDEIRTEVSIASSKEEKKVKGGNTLTVKAIEAMCTGIYDINNSSPVTPYIHAGLGVDRVKTDYILVNGAGSSDFAGSYKSKNEYKFAYKAGFGVKAEIGNVIIGVEYSAKNGHKQKITNITTGLNTGESVKLEAKGGSIRHIVQGNIGFIF